MKSWAISEFLLCDLGHLALGNHPPGLASVFASHQGTGTPSKKWFPPKSSGDLSLGVLTPLLDTRPSFVVGGVFLHGSTIFTQVSYPLLFEVHHDWETHTWGTETKRGPSTPKKK